MSLSRHLQTSGLLDTVAGMSYADLKEVVLTIGNAWYGKHPREQEVITENLRSFGLDTASSTIDNIRYHTILHYVEKFLPLTGSIESYARFLRDAVEAGNSIELLRKSQRAGRGICVTISHFGAVEFITPYLALHHLPMNTVLKFSTEAFSKVAHERSMAMKESGLFSYINLVEIGKPKIMAAMEMAAVLRRKEILLSVFDEKTPYSRPVDLFGTRVWGGAGLDRMIAFANTPVDLYVAFMIRGDNDTYRLELHPVDETETDPVAAMYRVLESVVQRYPHQWYFLHEKLPFVMEPV
ncbi:MAG: hypothetical protein JW863_02565 [Chitinispirillaceae bacterium]|nr:hypothetical protein [Chitinispirillaceae bacterium]